MVGFSELLLDHTHPRPKRMPILSVAGTRVAASSASCILHGMPPSKMYGSIIMFHQKQVVGDHSPHKPPFGVNSVV